MTTAAEIARALSGQRRSAQRLPEGGWLTSCPVAGHGKGRGDRKPSLYVGDGETRLLVRCYAGCNSRDVLDALRRRGLLPELRSDSPGKGPLGIWAAAVDAHDTPVERYLTKRGLSLPRGTEEVLRFHPACPFAGTTTAAMIALVRNIETNAPQAIHRTALDANGNKIAIDDKDRMALGPIAGGAIKLTANENVTIALGIAEGIETALSLQQLPEWHSSPIWSVISASGIRNFPLLTGIETLVIAADHDSAGERAAIELAELWQDHEVLVFEAHADGADLNDILRERAS
jgi:putative DNA primase/helicase